MENYSLLLCTIMLWQLTNIIFVLHFFKFWFLSSLIHNSFKFLWYCDTEREPCLVLNTLLSMLYQTTKSFFKKRYYLSHPIYLFQEPWNATFRSWSVNLHYPNHKIRVIWPQSSTIDVFKYLSSLENPPNVLAPLQIILVIKPIRTYHIWKIIRTKGIAKQRDFVWQKNQKAHIYSNRVQMEHHCSLEWAQLVPMTLLMATEIDKLN